MPELLACRASRLADALCLHCVQALGALLVEWGRPTYYTGCEGGKGFSLCRLPCLALSFTHAIQSDSAEGQSLAWVCKGWWAIMQLRTVCAMVQGMG